MKTSKKDYRHNTSKISVISPESSTFINIDRMMKQIDKATSEKDMTKTLTKQIKYLDTKIITSKKSLALLAEGCELIQGALENTDIQKIENNPTALSMITTIAELHNEIQKGKITKSITEAFASLVLNYHGLYGDLRIRFSCKYGEIASLLIIYSLIAFQSTKLVQAA